MLKRLTAGKSPRVDNIPSELLKNGGEATTTVLTAIMPEDLGGEGVAGEMNRIACHAFTKEGQLQAVSELSHHQPNQPAILA